MAARTDGAAAPSDALQPLLRAAWLKLDSKPGKYSAERINLRAHAALDGGLLNAGATITIPGLGTLLCTRVNVIASGKNAKSITTGRVTGQTQLHIEAAAPPAKEEASSPVFPAQQRGYDAVCALLRAAMPPQSDALRSWRVRPPSGVLLSGPPGTGKTHIVRQASKDFGVPLVAFSGGSSGEESGGEESGERLRSAFVRAEALSRLASASNADGDGDEVPCILFLDELDAYCPKRGDSSASGEQSRCVAVLLTLLDGLRSRHGRVLALAASNRPDAIDPALRRPGRLEWEVPLALPSASERREALRSSFAGVPLDLSVDLDEIASKCSGYAAADLIGLSREALLVAARRHAAIGFGQDETACKLRMSDLTAALQRSRASVLRPTSSLMAPVEPLPWDAIGGADETKLRLRRAIEWPTTRSEAFAAFGIRPPRGVLLHGPPGCAKTSLARAAAGASGVTFLYLSGASLYSPFVGEAERAVRELFALGRACAPTLLFLDELEAIVGSRSAVASSATGATGGEGVQLRVLSTLLNEMDGISPLAQVVVVGATNRVDMLDPALLRPGRFDEILKVELPSAAERQQILAIHAKPMPLSDEVNLKELAGASTDGWSGAQLSALCREAGMHALREGLKDEAPTVRQRHFAAAIGRVHGT